MMAPALWRDRSGAAALEFALVAPMFLMLVAGTAELSRWAWGAAATRDLAARAARCIAVTPSKCGSRPAVLAKMRAAAPMIAATTDITFEKRDCGVLVTAHGGFPAVLTPGLGPTTALACAG